MQFPCGQVWNVKTRSLQQFEHLAHSFDWKEVGEVEFATASFQRCRCTRTLHLKRAKPSRYVLHNGPEGQGQRCHRAVQPSALISCEKSSDVEGVVLRSYTLQWGADSRLLIGRGQYSERLCNCCRYFRRHSYRAHFICDFFRIAISSSSAPTPTPKVTGNYYCYGHHYH